MTKPSFSILIISLIVAVFTTVAFAQADQSGNPQSQELSEGDGIPVIIKHLPGWEAKKNEAVLITEFDGLRKEFGDKPIFGAIDFVIGTEAVAANYPHGKLLIVEFATPQASADTDNKVKQYLSRGGEQIFYRRIGNYNVFLFNGTDQAAADRLFGQIKYEKVVRWLGTDPFIQRRAEQSFIRQTSSLFIATVLVILMGVGLAIVVGSIAGVVFYNLRQQKRATMVAFSDGGGLTRLNLDRLTPDIDAARLLND